MTDPPREDPGSDTAGTGDLEQVPALPGPKQPGCGRTPGTAPALLGIGLRPGLRIGLRAQRSDTLRLAIPPADSRKVGNRRFVSRMDPWRSGDQFVCAAVGRQNPAVEGARAMPGRR